MFSTTANFRTRHWTSAIRRAAVYWADRLIRHARSGWVYALASNVARRSRHMARGGFQGSLSSQPGGGNALARVKKWFLFRPSHSWNPLLAASAFASQEARRYTAENNGLRGGEGCLWVRGGGAG